MSRDAAASKAPHKEATGWIGWLGLLAEAPGLGPWVSLGLLVIPLVPLILAGDALGLMEGNGRGTGAFLLVLFSASLVWLRFLERRTGIAISFYFIPCVWLAWAGVAMGAYGMLFGLS